jgi:hypothetical protein
MSCSGGKIGEKSHGASKINPVRFTLPILSTFGLLVDRTVRESTVYVSLITFLCSLVMFGNFPFLVTMNNSKPLYYEDLYVDSHKIPTIALSNQQKSIYKCSYRAILIVSNSILMSAIANYWMFKTSDVTSYYEVIGIIGGLLKIAGSLNHATGRLSICVIQSCIRNRITVMASTDTLSIEHGRENKDDDDQLDGNAEIEL